MAQPTAPTDTTYAVVLRPAKSMKPGATYHVQATSYRTAKAKAEAEYRAEHEFTGRFTGTMVSTVR
jgi:hypothetical protein